MMSAIKSGAVSQSRFAKLAELDYTVSILNEELRFIFRCQPIYVPFFKFKLKQQKLSNLEEVCKVVGFNLSLENEILNHL